MGLETMTRMYLKITEENDWEGEQWIHYVLVNGNEEVIERIRKLVKKYGGEVFKCAKNLKTEEEVMMKCARKAGGYMRKWGRNDRTLEMKLFKGIKDDQAFYDVFYKGGIRYVGAEEQEAEVM